MLAIQNLISRVGLLACALSLLISSSAWADSRVVVRAFKGPKGAQVRAVVIKELKERGFEILANKEVDRVARARGVGADEPSARTEVSRDLTVHAWVDGRVTRARGQLTAVISVQEGTGEQLGELSATRKQPAQLVTVVRRELWKSLGPALETARAPEPLPPSDSSGQNGAANAPPSTPVGVPSNLEWPTTTVNVKPESESSQPAEPTPREDTKKPQRELSAFEAAISVNTLTRTLRFRDAYAFGASDYQLAAAPLVIASARIYPGAFTRATIACCIGLDVSVKRAFALRSQSADGVTYKTKFDGATGSLVGRIPFAPHEINLLAGYGLQRFLIKGATSSSSSVPSVEYRHVRLGGGGRFALGSRTKLGFEASWLVILGTGQLGSASWFPRNTGGGLEGSLHVDVRLFGGLAARAHGSYQRSVFVFAPQQNNQRSESGAVDTYITAGLGLSYAY